MKMKKKKNKESNNEINEKKISKLKK